MAIEVGITYVVAIAGQPVSGPHTAEEAAVAAAAVPDGHVVEVEVLANGDVVNVATGIVIGQAA